MIISKQLARVLLFIGIITCNNAICAEVQEDTVKKDRKTPIVFMPDSLARDSLTYEYTKIKNAAYKSPITKELYKLVFINPKPNRVNVMRPERSEERFRPYNNKKINQITVKILPPYGSSVYDTTEVKENLNTLEKIANSTHIKTSNRVLLRQLTIKSGDLLKPFELVQNEILLRQLPFVDDATILVIEDEEDESKVNLLVICKDDFSWGAELSSNFINNFRISLINKNFASLGHEVEYKFSYRGTKDRVWGNMLQYTINNIFGTHFDITGYYQNDHRAKQVWIDVNRQFLTSATKWAGGFSLARAFRQDVLPELNVEYTSEFFNYNMQDVWLGKSFLLSDYSRYTPNIYITARLLNLSFKERPEVYVDSNELYYNRKAVYGAVAYRKIRYYKANLIYDFGRTEDIPVGLYMGLITGFENNDFKESVYLGSELKYAYFNRNTDTYHAINAALGSYIYKNKFERSVYRVGFDYISKLHHFGNCRFRFYNSANYIKGYKRYNDDYLYLNDRDILDFDSDTLRGHQKLSLSLATTLFLPHVVKGFRASITGTFDMGFITGENGALFNSKTYWGLGLSLNLRNDNIVFKNISLRLIYYPNSPKDMREVYASMSGKYGPGFYDYNIHKPRVISYD
ncbi:hypothetical protein LJC12_03225 [Odoribacter sp. OttesenSCG-928-J03]|nr:hypothetical protein [Odoribacter sp. OttesenSCG-928-J03]MDL2283497.1 hypothetical protein [Odoribacter sp. OttesenSCG-928-G04]